MPVTIRPRPIARLTFATTFVAGECAVELLRPFPPYPGTRVSTGGTDVVVRTPGGAEARHPGSGHRLCR
ncbi:hypothetical protein J2S43_002327 [Catenuloplanes nepalensis]|uniref:Uncharacterized protein n=1 Tax=Catenuloplanes nepalensis TaxID=587533 RepID=A0ABT9MQX6_9ACTN|nr:hypothetical protein [Catenuloplanes nepalensis]MDP9793815.1 hypothetical protein [Catenuloplanes nepalensis]